MKLLFYLIRHIIPIGFIAGAGIFVFNSAAPSSSSLIEGIGVDLMTSPPLSMEAVDSQLNAIQQAGIKYVRIEMDWSLIETSPDVYNWSAALPLDLFFSSAKAREITTVAVLTGGPVYLSTSGNAIDQKVLGERWEKFIQAAVGHFGEQIDIWEIGYQVNSSSGLSAFLFPSTPDAWTQPDPILYSKMLRAASKIIKNVDPNDEVWIGSLVSTTAGNCGMNPLTFLLEVNGAKGWNAADAVSYQPGRGGAAPEMPSASTTNQACGSSLPVNPANLSAEVQSLQELSRQLGGKPVYITGLTWSQEELHALHANRSIEIGQLESDLLVRASIMLMGNNAIPLVFWQIDPVSQWYAKAAMTNLSALLFNAKPIGQVQGQTGSVQEYRFQKAGGIKIFAWRTQDGDTPQPVNLTNLNASALTAFSTDSASLSNEFGTQITVDGFGNAIIMLNERPVVFVGKSGGWDAQIKQLISDQTELWRIEFQKSIDHWLNDQKAAFLRMLEVQFNKVKDSAVDWGEQKIDELLH